MYYYLGNDQFTQLYIVGPLDRYPRYTYVVRRPSIYGLTSRLGISAAEAGWPQFELHT